MPPFYNWLPCQMSSSLGVSDHSLTAPACDSLWMLQIPRRPQTPTAARKSMHSKTLIRSYTSPPSCFTHSKRRYTTTTSSSVSFPAHGIRLICVAREDLTNSSSHLKRFITQTVSRVWFVSCRTRAPGETHIFVSLQGRQFTLVLEAVSRSLFSVWSRPRMGEGIKVE